MRAIEKTIIIIIYVVVLGIAAYFIVASLFPEKVPFSTNTYTIKASDSKIFDKLSSFYIEDNSVLGDKITINDKIVRPITSAKKFNIVFLPKVNIPTNTNATIELNLIFDEGKYSDIYLNNELIFPNLGNYELINENEFDYVYVKKDLLPYIVREMLIDSTNTEEFIYKNFPSTSVWSTRKLNPINIVVDDYVKKDTLINGTFRDNLKLAVYAAGDLSISFTKQDLNSYIGQDEYTIRITDVNDNVVYYGLLEDDGVKTRGSLGREQYFKISKYNLDAGVYYISFIKDNYNDASDSTIKNIDVNNNKVLILGNFLLWDKFEFYTKLNFPKTIGFNYWWTDKDQIIDVSGSQKIKIYLSEEWRKKRYDINLTNGDFYFKIFKGYTWIYNDFSSIKKENWLEIPFFQGDNFDFSNVIVISKENYKKGTNEFNLKKDFNLNSKTNKVNLRILEPNIVYFYYTKLKIYAL